MLLTLFNGDFEYWELYHKVTFDGYNRLIIINSNESEIDIGTDIYSSWKEWSQLRYNTKFYAAMRAIGGDPTTGGDFAGATFFTINNWRVFVDHSVTFVGNMYSDNFASPFLVGDETFLATQRVSNLVDKLSISESGVLDVDITTHDTAGTMGEALNRVDVDVSTRASQTSVDTLSNALIAASSTVASGSTTLAVKSNLTQSDNFFNGMMVQIINSAGTAVRLVDEYSNSDGTIFVADAFPFTPASGDTLFILSAAGHASGRGKMG